MISKPLDLHTLAFILTLITMLLSAAMIFVWSRYKTYAGFGFWAISNLTAAGGFFLVGFRGVLPNFLTIIVANALASVSLILSLEGIRRFRGLPDCRFFSICVMALQISLFAYFTYIYNSVNIRIIIISLLMTIVCLRCAFDLIRDASKQISHAYRQVGLIFALSAVVSVFRAIFTYLYSDFNDFFVSDWVQSLAFAAFILFAIAWAFGYIILNSERMQKELQSVQVELEKLATTDFLTGINNNRSFFEISEKEISRARRFRHPLSIVMFDIDFFKRVNDEYGHATGDQVLVEIAGICHETLRVSDTLGRLGGEEFAVLLPHTDIDGAKTVAEYLRSAIEKAEIETASGIIKVTASFGITELKGTDGEIKELLVRADAALYEAKRNGRNGIIIGYAENPYQMQSFAEPADCSH